MCGRYFIDPDDIKLEDILSETGRGLENASELPPLKGGEIFPGVAVPVITAAKTLLMTWGYPGFAGKRPFINARSETAAVKKTFSADMASRRCLVPASGYYEWKTLENKRKEKYAFRLSAGTMMLMAGIYDPGGRFAILTREASPAIMEIHNRMPVIIPFNLSEAWLSITSEVLREAATDVFFSALP